MRLRYKAGVLLLASPLASHAADTGAAGAGRSADPIRLGDIVVTATRTPRPRRATLTPNTVITRSDIERSQARSVRELLRRTPGINVANQGGRGKLTSIFLRGTDSDQVLVLVDGVRFGDATSGLAKIQDLPVGQIERIEIVRGPRSSLYGSDAIGGVIQIFTRDGRDGRGDAGPKPYFSVGAGTYSTYEGQAGVSGSTARSNYNFGIGGTDTDGFNACDGRPFSAPGGGAGCFADQPDDDGYSRVSGSFNGGYRFDNGLQLNANYLRAEGDNEFDGVTTNQSDTVQEVYGLTADGKLADFWHAKLAFGHGTDESDDSLNGIFVSNFRTMRNSVSLQNDFDINADNLLTLGVDYRQDEVASTVDFAKKKRDNKGVFAQYLGTWGAHELQLAARGDDNEQFGEHATGSVTYGYDVTDVYTLTGSFGTAFKAPTFNDLYFPAFQPGAPRPSNPDLDPEESKSYEVGLKATPAWGHWSINGYETRVDQLIALDSLFVPQNISEARLRGVELDADTQLGAWRLSANATWLDAQNRGDGVNRGNELPRRPEYTAQFDVDREFGRYSAGASLFVASSRFDDLANTRELDGYELVDLRGALELTDDWQLQARLSNLLDEDYETVAFFNQPGRSVLFTLRYQP